MYKIVALNQEDRYGMVDFFIDECGDVTMAIHIDHKGDIVPYEYQDFEVIMCYPGDIARIFGDAVKDAIWDGVTGFSTYEDYCRYITERTINEF